MDTSLTEITAQLISAQPSRPTIEAYTATLQAQERLTPVVREALELAQTVQRNHQRVFYIAGPLTGMSEAVKQRYVELSQLITDTNQPQAQFFGYAPHINGTDPVKHPNVTPAEVRDIDYLWACVVPDAHFNFWDPMAHGNAIEAGWAEMHAIPSIHLVPQTVTLSRLVRGLHNTVHTITYQDFTADGLPQIAALLQALRTAVRT